MKLNVDREADALYLRLDDSAIVESEEVSPGVVLDYNEAKEVVGVELLNEAKEVVGGTFRNGPRTSTCRPWSSRRSREASPRTLGRDAVA